MTKRLYPRPVYLNLLQIRLPVAGIMSIIHRVTGVFMVLAIPLLMYLMQLSLKSPEGFSATAAWLAYPLVKFVLFLALWGLMHHFLAGIRYLLIDVEIGVDAPYYKNSAWVVMLASPLLALLLLGGLS